MEKNDKPQVLVVDDHELTRQGVRVVLSRQLGATCDEASRADEALAKLAKDDFDLVILDLVIPGRDGLELLGEIRRRWPKLPVVMLSGLREEDYAVRALRAGAAGFVSKGAPPAELVEAARKALAGGKFVQPAVAEQLASAPQGADLSQRELQILRLVATGKSRKEIAAELSLSEKTIATYRARIARKLGVSTNVELTQYAFRNHLVD